LTFDFAGFALLALDVLREFSRHKRVEGLRAAASAMTRLKDDLYGSKLHGIEVDDDMKEFRKRVTEDDRLMDRATVILGLDKTDLIWTEYGKRVRWEVTPNEVRAKADRAAAEPYHRAPIRLGTALVLLGFALQAVGSWPCP
jgi:hypothetical protein